MIPYMNVQRQYASISDELDRAALDVLHSGAYILGENVSNFEKKFTGFIGAGYGIGVGSGTDALVIALRAVGVCEGDEVIVPAMSFVATSEAVVNTGAIPVFADTLPDVYTIDPAEIEKKITAKTRAVIPVHIYGQCCDMDPILETAHKNGLAVIEDCAQAAGATYKGRRAGSFGDLSCFSFFPTKNLGACGDGGMILTNDGELAGICRAYRVHGGGLDGITAAKKRGAGRERFAEEISVDFGDNLPKYFNFVTGYNSRLDALQAALLSVKLDHLEEWNQKRRSIAERYAEGITNPLVKKPVVLRDNEHIYYAYVLAIDERDRFRDHMKENGVATGVYFPVPLHLQKVYSRLGYKQGDFPNAEYIAEHTAVIPMFPELTDEEIDTVIKAVNSFS